MAEDLKDWKPRFYRLDAAHNLLRMNDTLEWARWLETADRRVANTTVGDSHISTVFLGIDHNFFNGPPLVFETMVFGGPLDGDTQRYETWAEAEAGHAAMVRKVKAEAR